MPHRIMVSSRSLSVLRTTGAGEDARHRREVADIAIDDAEQRGNGSLVRSDRIEVTQWEVRETA
jgi:hypothetical protein